MKNDPKEQPGFSQEDMDNHANQLNPNNNAYWQSRGFEESPNEWEDSE